MFNSHDIIKVNKVSLSGEDIFVLSTMYLPLVGMNSYSIYMMFNNLNGDETQVKTILDFIAVSKTRDFNPSIFLLLFFFFF